ncbi:hypothetical protein D3C80_1201960 [compost metagenome]
MGRTCLVGDRQGFDVAPLDECLSIADVLPIEPFRNLLVGVGVNDERRDVLKANVAPPCQPNEVAKFVRFRIQGSALDDDPNKLIASAVLVGLDLALQVLPNPDEPECLLDVGFLQGLFLCLIGHARRNVGLADAAKFEGGKVAALLGGEALGKEVGNDGLALLALGIVNRIRKAGDAVNHRLASAVAPLLELLAALVLAGAEAFANSSERRKASKINPPLGRQRLPMAFVNDEEIEAIKRLHFEGKILVRENDKPPALGPLGLADIGARLI